MAPPGSAQFPLPVRRIITIESSSFTTATFTDGTRLFAAGASGSS
jgi:hypothetical protein